MTFSEAEANMSDTQVLMDKLRDMLQDRFDRSIFQNAVDLFKQSDAYKEMQIKAARLACDLLEWFNDKDCTVFDALMALLAAQQLVEEAPHEHGLNLNDIAVFDITRTGEQT